MKEDKGTSQYSSQANPETLEKAKVIKVNEVKGFGFAETSRGEKIYFRLNRCCVIEADASGAPNLSEKPCDQKPTGGETVVFIRAEKKDGKSPTMARFGHNAQLQNIQSASLTTEAQVEEADQSNPWEGLSLEEIEDTTHGQNRNTRHIHKAALEPRRRFARA